MEPFIMEIPEAAEVRTHDLLFLWKLWFSVNSSIEQLFSTESSSS